MEHILRIDVGTQEIRKEAVHEEYRLIGGRGLIAMIMNREVEARCEPLGPDNKLIVAPGLIAGTMAPSFGRISIGGKSPLTGGIKEANAGGNAAQKLDRLGIKALIIEGKREKEALWVLKISREGCFILPADELKGKRNYETVSELQARFGKQVGILSIGPAGEMQLAGATVAVTDQVGRPCRHAARGGLGAVMGAKGLKAIVIDDTGTSRVQVRDPEAFQKSVQGLVEALKNDKGTIKMNSLLGTPGALSFLNYIGSMPTMNYRRGSFELTDNLKGETIKEVNSRRGGRMHGCMLGCVVKCSIEFHGEDGEHLTSALEYETLAMMGSNMGIGDLDGVARLDRMCDELGLDTIEMGSALSQVMSAGRLDFGDAKGALGALEEVLRGTAFGKCLGNGTVAVSKALGLDRVPAVLGQAIPGHDPRGCKTVGVTYTTSAMGADHTAGLDYSDPHSKEGKVKKSKMTQIFIAGLDSVGYCMMALPSKSLMVGPVIADMINARYGSTLSNEDFLAIGRKTIQEELEFNRKAGIDHKKVQLPDFLKTEPLESHKSVFDVPREEIETIWEDFSDPERVE